MKKLFQLIKIKLKGKRKIVHTTQGIEVIYTYF